MKYYTNFPEGTMATPQFLRLVVIGFYPYFTLIAVFDVLTVVLVSVILTASTEWLVTRARDTGISDQVEALLYRHYCTYTTQQLPAKRT